MLIEERDHDRQIVHELLDGAADDNVASDRLVLVNEKRFAEIFGLNGTVVTEANGLWTFIDAHECWARLCSEDLRKFRKATPGVVLQWKPRTHR
jgi:hypothetical protein